MIGGWGYGGYGNGGYGMARITGILMHVILGIGLGLYY